MNVTKNLFILNNNNNNNNNNNKKQKKKWEIVHMGKENMKDKKEVKK